MTVRPPIDTARRTPGPLTYPARDTSDLPHLPDPDQVQANLTVELTRLEQRWPCWGLTADPQTADDEDVSVSSLQARIADDLAHQRQWSETRDPPVIGDDTERYVEQAMGQELRDAAEALGAGYIAWTSPPVWRIERDAQSNLWRRLYHARGALVRIVTDG